MVPTKNRVGEVAYYLDTVLDDLLYQYMMDTYDWSEEERQALKSFNQYQGGLTKKAFAHIPTAQRLVRLFESELAYNDKDTVVYTARCLGENNAVELKHIRGVIKEWDQNITPKMLDHIQGVHEETQAQELAQLAALTKKYKHKL